MRDTIELSALAMDVIHKLQNDFGKGATAANSMAMTEEQMIEFCVYFCSITLSNPAVLRDRAMLLTVAASKQVVTNTAPPEHLDMFRSMVMGETGK